MIKGTTIHITPICIKNHGIENREATIEVTYFIKEK